jgi:O-antigen ligase
MLWVIAILYFVLVGGTPLGDVVPALRIANAILGGTLVVIWLREMPGDNDLLDRFVLVGLLFFLATCVLSQFSRQSLDAGIAAMAYAAAFYVARRKLAAAGVRNLLIAMFRLVLAGMSVGVLAIWGSRWIEWLRLHEWRSLPPLDMTMPAGIWGHQHDLIVLLILLTPALVVRPRLPRSALLAGGAFVLIGALLVIDGSRNTWLALAVGLVAAALTTGRQPKVRLPRLLAAAGFLGLVAVVVMLTTNLDDQLIRRLTTLQTLGARFDQWQRALELWSTHWLQGVGPGSYPFQMRLTDYFRESSYVSRHPDGALIQMLAETGIIGVAAVALLVAAVVIALRHSPHRMSAVFVTVVFAFAGIGANPADYGFLIVVLLLWVAFAIPAGGHQHNEFRRALTVPITASAALVALVIVAMSVGLVAYDGASRAMAGGDYEAADAWLNVAVGADPGLALYWRERGTAKFLAGDLEGALVDTDAAIRRNGADDVSYRLLALVQRRLSNQPAAMRAAEQATERVWSDETNQEVLALAAVSAGQPDIAAGALAATVLDSPSIIAADAWKQLLPHMLPQADVIAAAARSLRSKEIRLGDFNATWIASLADDQELLARALTRVPRLQQTALALDSLIACNSSLALNHIRGAESKEGSEPFYWIVRMIIERRAGTADARISALVRLLAPGTWLLDQSDEAPSPDAFAGGLRDQWGYRRLPIVHPRAGNLASSAQGLWEWLHAAQPDPSLGEHCTTSPR